MIELSRYARTLNNKPVAVYGLGLSGLAAVRALIAAGADVIAWDDDEPKRISALKAGATIDMMQDLTGCAALILSPGIPLHFPQPHAVVERAHAAGVEVIGDIEVLHRSGMAKTVIGITGTNGKSTTTALLGHILKSCDIDVAVGGNIGTAVLDLTVADVFVLELSSYQLDLCATFAPEIAVHLNLTPDHIDRHGDLAGYIAAKMRIFRGTGQAMIGTDDAASKTMLEAVRKERKREIFQVATTHGVQRGVFVENNLLFDAMDDFAAEVADLRAMTTLQGVHNQQNAAAAFAAARLMGLEAEAIIAAMRTYPGLPHRMYTVRTINGIAYINDSKATNADAAGKALACYDDIHWIVGGKAKEGGLNELDMLMPHVNTAYAIGEAAIEFMPWLIRNGVKAVHADTLDQAVVLAHRNAQAQGKGVVLLSPACASYDQFRSFEHRGQVFTDLVNSLDDKKDGKA